MTPGPGRASIGLVEADLRKNLAEGHVAIFVGTGVSIAASGRADAASWQKLLELGIKWVVELDPTLANGWASRARADIESKRLNDLLVAAQRVSSELQRLGVFGRWLEDTVGKLTIAPGQGEVLEALLALDAPLFTTNYDDLLEQASQHSLRTLTWKDSADVEAVLRGTDRAIVHLHGYWRDPDSVVLGADSYERVRQSQFAQQTLRALRTTRSLLFVGYGEGLNDPNFGAWLDWSRTMFRDSKLWHFRLALTGEREALQATHPAEEHIRVVAYGDKHNQLCAYLRSLREPAPTGLASDEVPDRPRRSPPTATGTEVGRVLGPKFRYPVPFVPARFEDRRRQTHLVGMFLNDPAKRLLVVHGRSGLGKTSLVCHVLEGLKAIRQAATGAQRDADGVDGVVYLSALGSHRVTVPDLFAGIQECLPAEVADDAERLLSDSKVGTRKRMFGLSEAAGSERIVVLLDNFESVVNLNTGNLRDGDAELYEALYALLEAPHHQVKVILTTRVLPRDLLTAYSERIDTLFLNAGLPHPFGERILRAMDGDGSLGLRSASESLLTEARDFTDGNPKTLEILVGILRTNRDRNLRDVLNDATAPEDLVGYLFRGLDLPAQQIMQALAIYGHPVTAEAVDYLLQPYVPTINSAPLLSRLYNWYLARKEEESGGYYLHSIERAYALSRIPDDEAAGRERGEHALFTRTALFLRGADYFRHLRTPSERWHSRLDVLPQLDEFDLRCAGHDYDEAARILLEIDYQYLSRWGLNSLVAQMHERLQGRLSDAGLRHDSASRLGKAYWLVSRYSDAANRFEEAMHVAHEMGDRIGEASALSEFGHCHLYLGDLEQAIEEQQQALALVAAGPAANSDRVTLGANHVLGFSYSTVGKTELAVQHAEVALSVARKLGDQREECMELGYLGLYSSYLGRTDQAVVYDKQAMDLARRLEARWEEAFLWGFLAEVRTQRGEYAEAIHSAEEALAIERELENRAAGSQRLGWSYQWLSVARCLTGDLAAARTAAEAACRFEEPLNNQNPRAILGVIALRQGDEAAAIEALESARRLADALIERSASNWEALDAKGLALCGLALCRGDDWLEQAASTFRRARRITRDLGTVRRSTLQVDLLAPLDAAGRLAAARRAAAGEDS